MMQLFAFIVSFNQLESVRLYYVRFFGEIKAKHLYAPEKAGTEMEGARQRHEELDCSHFGRCHVQLLRQKAMVPGQGSLWNTIDLTSMYCNN